MGILICINIFIILSKFAHLSSCSVQSYRKAREGEPEVMHFARAGAEHTISYLLQGPNTPKHSTAPLA